MFYNVSILCCLLYILICAISIVLLVSILFVHFVLPIWALAHMGQARMGKAHGPYGRIWAWANLGWAWAHTIRIPGAVPQMFSSALRTQRLFRDTHYTHCTDTSSLRG